MCLIDFTIKLKKGARWMSGLVFSKKKFECDYCEKMKPKGTAYRWIDGMKSCHDCNLVYDYNYYYPLDQKKVDRRKK